MNIGTLANELFRTTVFDMLAAISELYMYKVELRTVT